ncbi:MAG: hypothetical protein JXR37_01590 [Kiritimatiellae bacterium]|nr:hypothetical protein [Kiritimatiellia bacterium]
MLSGTTDVLVEIGYVTIFFVVFTLLWLVIISLMLRVQANRLRARDAQEMRMMEVTSRYLVAAREQLEENLYQLMKAGAWSLENDAEIREVCERVERFSGKSPLGRYRKPVEEIGLHAFFTTAVNQGVDFQDAHAVEALLVRLNPHFSPAAEEK